MELIFQDYCQGWETCGHKDLRNLFKEKILRGDEFELPDEHELNRLNGKCRECTHELVIENEECPICGNKNLGPLKEFFGQGQAAITIEGFYYRCNQCSRKLVSSEEF